MAASAMTPKLLDRIPNKEYQEKDKWKIDDIALGPANELLISGHNLETPETFISVYKEDSGKYDYRPEFNRSFRQPQPGEQLALFLEGSSKIGLKFGRSLRLVSISGMGILKTLNWKRSPTCVCFYRGKLYAASSSTNIVSVCTLDSEEKSDIVLSDMRSDCVLDMVVVMAKIYVCTKNAGRVLVFSMAGSKKLEFKNAFQSDAKATSICIHERTELVFVLWNNIQIHLYSQMTSRCLRALDMTENLHKIRVTTKNMLVTLSASKCIVSVYDVGEAIKFGESQNTLLSSVKKKHRKKLMSSGEENLECYPAAFEALPTNWKSAPKQSKVENLRDMKELYIQQLEENGNCRRKDDRDIQKLNEKIKYLEDMRTEYESQQKELKDTLDQEKEKVTRAEGSRVQAVKNLKKVEERNTKLEDEVTQLKERLLVEEKTTKEVQTSSLMLNERIKDLEDMRTELQSQQKKLKETLDQEKDKVTRAEGSRSQVVTYLKKVEERNTELEVEVTQLKERLLVEEKTPKEVQTSSLMMTSHALSGSEKTAQRKSEDSYLCNETQSVITESTDSGRSSMHAGLEYQDPFILDGRQLNAELKVAVTVASKGANMHIPDTGVELDIPTGAAQGKVLIEMIILPFGQLDAPVSTFSCNSSVAVELLPNKMEFQRPVRLILPHCLMLTKNYQQTKNQVKVYVSHHETGPPIWEEVSIAKYVLNETNCLIFLKSFCWVKYEVNNKIVEAKRIRVYTAGKRLKHTEDSLAETEVGYHWDLPIARENLSVNDNMFVYQSKPFIFVKQGNLPLEILLTKTVPKQWKYITPEDNPKVISFKCVADSKEKTCPFVIEKLEPTDGMPFCMFKVQQGNEDMEIYIRFDD